jgi:hypothetical protein
MKNSENDLMKVISERTRSTVNSADTFGQLVSEMEDSQLSDTARYIVLNNHLEALYI